MATDAKWWIRSIFWLLAGLASQAASANLIVNGDFEADAIGGPNAGSGFEYRLSLTGWTVADSTSPFRGAVLFNSAYGEPLGGGLQSLQLEDDQDSISQVIATTIGQQYLLSFDLSAYHTPGSASVSVGIGASTFLYAGSSASYVTYTQLFTATAGATSISFTSNVSSGARYPHLDDISITAVPEPAPLTLLGLALLGVRLRRRG